jgi:small subunit ribosomal protein S6
MNQYETVFILTPVLSDEQMKEAVAKFKKILTDNGAEILNEETWGLKKDGLCYSKEINRLLLSVRIQGRADNC